MWWHAVVYTTLYPHAHHLPSQTAVFVVVVAQEHGMFVEQRDRYLGTHVPSIGAVFDHDLIVESPDVAEGHTEVLVRHRSGVPQVRVVRLQPLRQGYALQGGPVVVVGGQAHEQAVVEREHGGYGLFGANPVGAAHQYPRTPLDARVSRGADGKTVLYVEHLVHARPWCDHMAAADLR